VNHDESPPASSHRALFATGSHCKRGSNPRPPDASCLSGFWRRRDRIPVLPAVTLAVYGGDSVLQPPERRFALRINPGGKPVRSRRSLSHAGSGPRRLPPAPPVQEQRFQCPVNLATTFGFVCFAGKKRGRSWSGSSGFFFEGRQRGGEPLVGGAGTRVAGPVAVPWRVIVFLISSSSCWIRTANGSLDLPANRNLATSSARAAGDRQPD